MQPTPWLIRKASGIQRRMRLYCLSYAGGSAHAFASWQDGIDTSIEVCAVQLPGRGSRFREPPRTSMPALIEELAGIIDPNDDLPFAFFGHSLGGLLAFELARHCQGKGLRQPEQLIVSGCAAPQHRTPPVDKHKLPDDQFIEMLKDYNGTPPELLQNDELMTLVLPMLRADFGLVEEYRYQSTAPLTQPITVLAGRHDDHVSALQVEGWAKETTGECRTQWFEGDHFFLHAHRAAILQLLSRNLASAQQA